jgi:hypothetical protein
MTQWTCLLRAAMLLACMLLVLLDDAVRFLLLCLHPSHTLTADNLFLRKQWVFCQARGVTLLHATDVTHMVMTWLPLIRLAFHSGHRAIDNPKPLALPGMPAVLALEIETSTSTGFVTT